MSDSSIDPAAEKAALRKDAGKARAALASADVDAAGRLAAQAGIVAEIATSLSGEDTPHSSSDVLVVAAFLVPCASQVAAPNHHV